MEIAKLYPSYYYNAVMNSPANFQLQIVTGYLHSASFDSFAILNLRKPVVLS